MPTRCRLEARKQVSSILFGTLQTHGFRRMGERGVSNPQRDTAGRCARINAAPRLIERRSGLGTAALVVYLHVLNAAAVGRGRSHRHRFTGH